MLAANLARRMTLACNNSGSRVHGMIYRGFQTQPKESFTRRAAKTARSTAAPAGGKTPSMMPLLLGGGFAAGASAVGLCSLAYYGLSSASAESGARIIDKSATWPAFIRERISTTYTYFGASLGVTAASAVAISRSPALMSLATKNSMMAMFGSIALMIGSGMLVRSIPYQEGTVGSKQLAWALHAGIVGAIIAPMTLMGGPLLLRAAWYTAGIAGGLSMIAATAPSEKFLNMGGPLAIGMGAVFASSVAGMWLPPTTTLGLSLYSVSIYGGLVLFSMFLLYDTQKIVHRAENSHHYDPVNESLSIYMDTINIFIRMVAILGGNRKK